LGVSGIGRSFRSRGRWFEVVVAVSCGDGGSTEVVVAVSCGDGGFLADSSSQRSETRRPDALVTVQRLSIAVLLCSVIGCPTLCLEDRPGVARDGRDGSLRYKGGKRKDMKGCRKEAK
jgi:hypothetical protein